MRKKNKPKWVHWGTRNTTGHALETLCGKKGPMGSCLDEYGALTTNDAFVTCPRCLEILNVGKQE